MNHSFAMRNRYGAAHFNRNAGCNLSRQGALFAEQLAKSDAANQFDVEILLVLALRRDIIDFYYVGVFDLSMSQRFALRAPADLRALSVVLIDHLDCVFPRE